MPSSEKLVEIEVVFKDHVSLELIRGMGETEFVGLCEKCKTTNNPRVLMLWPSQTEYETVILQLMEYQRENALTFSERPANIGS